jgi:hypothetical protein
MSPRQVLANKEGGVDHQAVLLFLRAVDPFVYELIFDDVVKAVLQVLGGEQQGVAVLSHQALALLSVFVIIRIYCEEPAGDGDGE